MQPDFSRTPDFDTSSLLLQVFLLLQRSLGVAIFCARKDVRTRRCGRLSQKQGEGVVDGFHQRKKDQIRSDPRNIR